MDGAGVVMFTLAFSALYAFADGRCKYRLLYCGNTYLDDLTCEEAISHMHLLNGSYGETAEGLVA